MKDVDADHRVEMPGTTPERSGRNPRGYGVGASNLTARTESVYPETSSMMDAVVERDNLWSALRRVERNGGVAGVDSMPVEALRPYLKAALAAHQRGTAVWAVRAQSGVTGSDSQAGRERSASIGHSHGAGPLYSAGLESGNAAGL